MLSAVRKNGPVETWKSFCGVECFVRGLAQLNFSLAYFYKINFNLYSFMFIGQPFEVAVMIIDILISIDLNRILIQFEFIFKIAIQRIASTSRLLPTIKNGDP